MDKFKYDAENATESKLVLRKLAETLVNGSEGMSKETLANLPLTLVLKMLHELKVHEVELEMQNETLRQTQLQLLAMQARYFDLYDLAPISYCTVNETGIILEANLAIAELLGVARNSLVGQRISHYIHKDFQDIYYLCRKLLLSSHERQTCELHMSRTDDSDFWVNLAVTSALGSNGDTLVRMVLTDITNAKVMALAMEKSESQLRAVVNSSEYMAFNH